MDKSTRHSRLLESQLELRGWVAHLINRGEQVKYFDGSRHVEGEVTWSWTSPSEEGQLPSAISPLHIHSETLYVANPPALRGALSKAEQLEIATRIQEAFLEQGTEALVEFKDS